MHKSKRQRTKPPHSPSRHASPFRSPTPEATTTNSNTNTSPKGRYSKHNYDTSRRGTPYGTALESTTIPKGLFPPSTKHFPAFRFSRSRKIRARYFLFEDRADKPAKDTKLANYKTRTVAPMLNYVQILTTPTADTPGTCLVVHHDNRRYLFGNVAEGTQRAFVQQKVALSRVEELFLTGPIGWQTAGGLLGMVLTVAEVVQSARAAAIDEAKAKLEKTLKNMENQKAKTKAAAKPNPKIDEALQAAKNNLAAAESAPARTLSIHGGTNLSHLIATARRFIFRKGMPIKPHEIREDTSLTQAASASSSSPDGFRDPDWTDENIMVWYVPVFADSVEPNPKKRMHEEEDSNRQAAIDSAMTAAEIEASDRELVSSVVNHMFDSDWKLDALVETTLHAAKLPAKLFVKDENGHLKEYDGPMPGSAPASDIPDIPVLVRQPWPGALITSLPRTQPARQSMCYIVRNYPRRGKFDAQAAAKLGVDKRDNRNLVAGQSVITKDGKTVTPDMVIAADVEGAAFGVVELPDTSYIDAFLAKPEWSEANSKMLGAIDTMFWLLGPDVVADARIQAFMKKHSGIRHTVSSTDTCGNRLALSSAAALQVKHNRVDPDRFPIQQYDNVAKLADVESPPYVAARTGWSVRLAPQVLEEDQKVFPYVDFADAIREMDRKVLTLADNARAQIAEPAFKQAVDAANTSLPYPDAEVIPLGTGSAIPSKYRNVSATLVRVPGVGSYLFDCGENTLGSMRRLWGEEKLDEVLRELRVLWISHLHADHHLGTVSVLKAWRDATAGEPHRRLMVASHVNMLHWLREYSDVEDFGIERLYQVDLDAPDFPRTKICTPKIFSDSEAAEFGLDRLDACRVEHCHGALAVVFTWRPDPTNPGAGPLKVSYSGDCRPSDEFGVIGRGTTLLIHESTFDDELAGEARAKKHSTMGEALSVGRAMGARRVLLTHFSQRYPKIPVFNAGENNSVKEMQVLVAFDQMTVRLGDFKTAAAFLPALQKLYEGEEVQGKKDKDKET